MAAAEQVHWKQGLFLQPHHLQLMQRHVLERIAELRRLSTPFAYGVVQWQLDQDAIVKARLIRFRSLHVIMKSGLEVKFADGSDLTSNAELSQLDFGPAFDSSSGSLTISLAVPQWQAQRPNAFEPSTGDTTRADALYIVRQATLLDENEANENRNERTLEIRRINARLVINASNLSGFEVLPLLKIRRGTQGEFANKPIRDSTYVPPSIFINSSSEIQVLVQSLSENIKASRQDLAKKLPRDGFNLNALREAQIGGLIKLQSLNRAAGRLPALLEVGNTPLFDLYLELRTILGDFLALFPEKDDLFETPRYQHENPFLCFDEVCKRISSCIVIQEDTDTVTAIPFEDKQGRLIAKLTEDSLTKPTMYYIAVQTAADPTELVRAVEEGIRFKLKALTRYPDARRGVRLVQDVNPHASLNRQPGLIYFKVDRSTDEAGREWAQISAEKDVAIKTPGPTWYPDAKYTLQMILPMVKK